MKFLLIPLILLFTACQQPPAKPNADIIQQQQTEKALSQAQAQIGMPNVVNFQQRKLMKLIYELCDKEKLICHAYIKSDYTGKLIYLGKCFGYGIPFSAQYTNPSKVIDPDHIPGHRYHNAEGIPTVIPQADPNGLFMPTSSSATWLIMVNPENQKPAPVYIESELTISPFKLKLGVM